MTVARTDPPRPTGSHDGEAHLTDAEIEAILEREAAGLPPEPDQSPQPQLAVREPGRGRLGKILVWLVLAFILASVFQFNRG